MIHRSRSRLPSLPGMAVAVVVVSSAIFAAFKNEFLGHEDPHWHKPKAPSLELKADS